MSYLEKYREELFTEKNFLLLLSVRDRALELLYTSGAFTTDQGLASGSIPHMMACLEYLAEIGDLRKLNDVDNQGEAIYVAGPKWKGKRFYPMELPNE